MTGEKMLLKDFDVSEEEILRLLDSTEEDKKWIRENYDSLRKKYAGQFILVRNKKVMCASNDLSDLLPLLDEDPSIVCEYILPEDMVILL